MASPFEILVFVLSVIGLILWGFKFSPIRALRLKLKVSFLSFKIDVESHPRPPKKRR